MPRNRRDMLDYLDSPAHRYLDRDGIEIPRDEFLERIYQQWLSYSIQKLSRIPEHAWLFEQVHDADGNALYQDGKPALKRDSGGTAIPLYKWWGADEVAAQLGISLRSVYALCLMVPGVRGGGGKAGYRLPTSGVLIALAYEDENAQGDDGGILLPLVLDEEVEPLEGDAYTEIQLIGNGEVSVEEVTVDK